MIVRTSPELGVDNAPSARNSTVGMYRKEKSIVCAKCASRFNRSGTCSPKTNRKTLFVERHTTSHGPTTYRRLGGQRLGTATGDNRQSGGDRITDTFFLVESYGYGELRVGSDWDSRAYKRPRGCHLSGERLSRKREVNALFFLRSMERAWKISVATFADVDRG